MITKEEIGVGNWAKLREKQAVAREDMGKQEEALADALILREYAETNGMHDDVVELFLEEALIWQHKYMVSSEGEKDPQALEQMRRSINGADSYVVENRLSQWESRVARFKGRLADYDGKFEEALDQYGLAIKKVHQDPNFARNPAMVFEYKGFQILNQVRLGRVDEGIEAGERLYEDYDTTSEGNKLKGEDYTTWAVWRSGLLINLCRGIKKIGKTSEYKEKMREWLTKAETDLTPPEGVKTWADFSFRKKEIAEIREDLL